MSSRRPPYRPTEADLLRSRATDAAQHADLTFIAAMVRGDANAATLSEVGGLLAGSWFARPGMSTNDDLIAAGLVLTGHIDHGALLDWIREGWRRAGVRGGPWAIPRRGGR